MKRASDAGQSASSASATVDPVSSLVPLDERAELLGGLVASTGAQLDELAVDAALVEVEHAGDAAGHAGREVAAGRAEDHDAAAGHVLAAVVADALDDGDGAGVADAEALADLAAQEDLARRSRRSRSRCPR